MVDGVGLTAGHDLFREARKAVEDLDESPEQAAAREKKEAAEREKREAAARREDEARRKQEAKAAARREREVDDELRALKRKLGK